MSTFTIPGLRTVRTLAKHAGKTPTELKADIARLETDNAAAIAGNEDLVCALASAVVRGCQDSMRIAQVETELAAAVREIKRLQDRTCRDAANLERLRQAVINARPRITVVDTQLVRPYAPEIVLPYVSPVPHHDTSNETTQQLPIVDIPGQRPAA